MQSARIVGVLVLLLVFAPAAFADDARGAELFKAKCAACHAEDGNGTATGKKLDAPKLSDNDLQDRSDKRLRGSVSDGRGKMPAFNAELSYDEIVDVVIHVRSFWQPSASSK